MSYEIIRGPFILMETVEMLYKYVNNISFLNIASRLRLLRGGMDAEMQRRMERLQKLTQEVCGGFRLCWTFTGTPYPMRRAGSTRW